MRILFLDLDGVLNSDEFTPSLPVGLLAPAHASIDWLAYQLDPMACRLVASICDRSKAAIVLSTTWRNAFPLPRIGELFVSLGLPMPIGATPLLQAASRAHEISRWVETASPESFVVLEDDPMDLPEIAARLVQTDPSVGLTRLDADRCVDLFSPPE